MAETLVAVAEDLIFTINTRPSSLCSSHLAVAITFASLLAARRLAHMLCITLRAMACSNLAKSSAAWKPRRIQCRTSTVIRRLAHLRAVDT